jgi:threonine dehydrogenase-like Zn-dependent dehydrogenase
MRATVMYGAHDVRVENVPDARLIEPTDALVRVTRACICGSDLWPYNSMAPSAVGNRMGHEFIGVVESIGADVRRIPNAQPTFYANITIAGGPAPVRAYMHELLPDVMEGRIEPGLVFDRTTTIGGVPDGYRSMNDREAIKVMIEF